MQNTQQFIEQHEDELFDVMSEVRDSEDGLEDAVCKFVQEMGADVDTYKITLYLARGVLHNYYDDGGDGGLIMVGFFEEVGHDGYNCMYEFDDKGGNTRAVVETSDFVRYAMQQTAVQLSMDISDLEAYEYEQNNK